MGELYGSPGPHLEALVANHVFSWVGEEWNDGGRSSEPTKKFVLYFTPQAFLNVDTFKLAFSVPLHQQRNRRSIPHSHSVGFVVAMQRKRKYGNYWEYQPISDRIFEILLLRFLPLWAVASFWISSTGAKCWLTFGLPLRFRGWKGEML